MSDSGAGAAPAGGAPAGVDAVQVPSANGSVVSSALVPYYDLRTRQFPRNAAGRLLLVHWVDQAVELALGITNGTFAPQSSLGNKLRLIKRAGGPTLRANVEDAVQNALASLLTRKDIKVVEIAITLPIRGQIVLAVTYVNLRLAPYEAVALRSAF